MNIPTADELFYCCYWLAMLCGLIVLALAFLALLFCMVVWSYAAYKIFVMEMKERMKRRQDSELPKLSSLIGLFKDNPVDVAGDWGQDESKK